MGLGLSNAGGDIPNVRLYNEVGDFIRGDTTPSTSTTGQLATTYGSNRKWRSKPPMASFTANKDAIRLAYLTMVLLEHRTQWSGQADIHGIDRNHDQPVTAFQVHFPEFVATANEPPHHQRPRHAPYLPPTTTMVPRAPTSGTRLKKSSGMLLRTVNDAVQHASPSFGHRGLFSSTGVWIRRLCCYKLGSLLGTCMFIEAELSVPWNLHVMSLKGQGADQGRLSQVCQQASNDIVALAFLHIFPDQGAGGYPGTNFRNACGPGYFTTPNGSESQLLSGCADIAQDITLCQSLGKKILISIGGATLSTSMINDDTSTIKFADFVWGAFGPNRYDWTGPRPFGDAAVADLTSTSNTMVQAVMLR
ncbi:MAG: hypothetical protein M1816_006151 [Peltula sp. TS41687]|nr:MAG: hypothetical protein M1816_006151 [Peltula sp. TS41687]